MKNTEMKAILERIANSLANELAKRGGHARKNALSPRRRSEIASKAAKARWKKVKAAKRKRAA